MRGGRRRGAALEQPGAGGSYPPSESAVAVGAVPSCSPQHFQTAEFKWNAGSGAVRLCGATVVLGLLLRLAAFGFEHTGNRRGGTQEVAAGTEELDFIFLDEPHDFVAGTLILATAEETVANQNGLVQVRHRFNPERRKLLRNGVANFLDWGSCKHLLCLPRGMKDSWRPLERSIGYLIVAG